MNRIALLFPGQGSQYPGMGVDLASRSPAAAETFRRASESLGWDVLAACSGSSMEKLTRGDTAQAAIITVSLAYYHHLVQEMEVRPDFLAGHSLGEIAALACAGAFDLETAVRLAQWRGEIMREAAVKELGVMCAILGLPLEEVARVCSKHDRPGSRVVISNENALDQLVISGHRHAVEAACESLAALGARTRPIEVDGAFHSPLMAAAAGKFGEHLASIRPRELAIPVLSSITARPHEKATAIPFLLKRQVVETVRWRGCFDFLVHARVKVFIECGPGSVLTRLARKAGPGFEALSLDDPADQQALSAHLKMSVGAKDFVSMCLAAAAASRNRGAPHEKFESDGVPAYRELESLRLKISGENRSPSKAEISRSLALAEIVLESKRSPERLAELRTLARRFGIVPVEPDHTDKQHTREFWK